MVSFTLDYIFLTIIKSNSRTPLLDVLLLLFTG